MTGPLRLIEPDDVSDGKPYIYVSYSRRDRVEAQAFLHILRRNRYRFWYDRRTNSDAAPAEYPEEKIRGCAQFMTLITPSSVLSRHVRKEIGTASDGNRNVLVVYLAETLLTGSLNTLLNSFPAIHRSRYTEGESFERAVCEYADKSALYARSPAAPAPESDFRRNYELQNELGHGGVGRVLLARQLRTGNPVAVKCAKDDGSVMCAVERQSFRNEMRILSALQLCGCPFVPALLDWYEEEDGVYLVETLMPGDPLQTSQPLPEKEVIGIAKKVLRILTVLHRNNVLYGDMKPMNLLADENGDVYLVDFNSSFFLDRGPRRGNYTHGYASPEQLSGNGFPGFASDIYSLGRTMEYLLSPEDFARYRSEYYLRRVPVRHYRSDVSPALEAILAKMTDPVPDRRYRSAGELLEALERCGREDPLTKLRLRLASGRRLRAYRSEAEPDEEKRPAAIRRLRSSSDRTTLGDDTVLLNGETALRTDGTFTTAAGTATAFGGTAYRAPDDTGGDTFGPGDDTL